MLLEDEITCPLFNSYADMSILTAFIQNYTPGVWQAVFV